MEANWRPPEAFIIASEPAASSLKVKEKLMKYTKFYVMNFYIFYLFKDKGRLFLILEWEPEYPTERWKNSPVSQEGSTIIPDKVKFGQLVLIPDQWRIHMVN